jgi:hypothetical protein
MDKDKVLLIYPDKRRRISGWVTFMDVLFKIALVISIILTAIFMIIVVAYPLLYICLVIITLGLFLLVKDKQPNFGKSFSGILPILSVVWALTIGLFLIKWVFEWLAIMRQTARLKKDPEANRDRIALAMVIRKSKLINLIICFVTAAAAAAIGILLPQANDTMEKVLPIVSGVVVLGALIVGKVAISKMFKKVQPSVKAIYALRKEGK